jgi:hypothetical protein
LAEHTIFDNKLNYCLRHRYHFEFCYGVRESFRDPRSHAAGFSWSRLEHMAEMVESMLYEWVWVVGADTLITNLTINLESIIALAETDEAQSTPLPRPETFENNPMPPKVIDWPEPPDHPRTGKKHLLICGERVAPMQADSFLVRCSPEGSAYLRDILSHYEEYKHHPWVENQTMIDLREKHAAITFMVPQWKLNSLDYRRFLNSGPMYKDGTDCFGNRGQWEPGDFLVHWPAATLEARMTYLSQYTPKIIK